MKVGFDGGIKLEFHGAKVTSDGGLLAYRDLDYALGLFDSVSAVFIVTTMSAKPEGVVHFYNGRGTAEQWIKEGKYALNWTR